MLYWAKFMDSVKFTDGNECQKMRKGEKLIKPKVLEPSKLCSNTVRPGGW